MRIFKSALKILAIVAFAACVNACFTFAIEPYGSKSQVMWTDYRRQENLDMVFVGTSLAERAFDPAVIDAQLGTNSYNMATPGQWIEESYLALQTAVKDHRPKTIVFGFEYCDVQGDSFPDPGRAFLRYKSEGDFPERLKDIAYCLSNERCYTEKSSINWLFSWLSNHVKMNPSAIINNIRMKLDGTTVYEAAAANERGWTYFGKGYGNYTTKFKYGEGSQKVYSDAYGKRDFDGSKLGTLVKMCDFCRRHDIEFLVVAPPVAVFNVLEYGNKYFAQSEQLRELVEQHGGEYYDLNLARPELLDVTNTGYFADYQHLNATGGEAVSKAFVQLMKAREAGVSVDALFYEQEEYLQSKSYIDFVLLETEPEVGSVLLKAQALAGPGIRPEYQVCLLDESGEAWTEIRGWSQDSQYVFAPEKPGTYMIRVNAREVGSEAECDRYRVVKVTV